MRDRFRDTNGEIPDLTAARVAFQHIVEMTELRWRNGDIFLYGRRDAELAIKALGLLDELQADGYRTGIRQTELVMNDTWGASERFKGRNGNGKRITDR